MLQAPETENKKKKEKTINIFLYINSFKQITNYFRMELSDCFLYDVFLICTVREADENDKKFLDDYVIKLENEGKKVYYPPADTNQIDESGGYRICSDNLKAIMDSQEVHVYWTEKSQGTKFDLGIAFMEHRTKKKNIRLANRNDVEKIVNEQMKNRVKKSFEMVLLKLDDLANK